MQRKERNRDYEKAIDPEYLHTLNVSYDKWIASIKDMPVLTIDTNNFNIFEDKEELQSIIKAIDNRL